MFFGWFLWFRKPGQPHVEQAEEDEGGNGHLLKDSVKHGKAVAKNFQLAEFDAQNFPDRVRKSFLRHSCENAWSINSAHCIMFIFMLTLAYYCDEKVSMLTKIFPYNSNNLQPVKQIPKIFQVVQKLSRYFHTDQKIQTVRRLSKLSGHSLDISVEFQRPNFPDVQNFLFLGSIANSPTSV